ncbi:hypothetical protein PspLS_10622 [Pyricularia sp. CBS 133598]|nr:hypothetical protein PspLS_10622 [Pyricularia sp. CBS 133598]
MAGTCATHGEYSGNSCTFCWKAEKPIKKSCGTKDRRHCRGSDDCTTMSAGTWCKSHQIYYTGTSCPRCMDAVDRHQDLSMPNSADALIHAEQVGDCDGLHQATMMN